MTFGFAPVCCYLNIEKIEHNKDKEEIPEEKIKIKQLPSDSNDHFHTRRDFWKFPRENIFYFLLYYLEKVILWRPKNLPVESTTYIKLCECCLCTHLLLWFGLKTSWKSK